MTLAEPSPGSSSSSGRIRASAPRLLDASPVGRAGVRTASLTYLGALLLLPLAAVSWDALRHGPGAALAAVSTPAASHALTLTLWTSALVCAVNAVMGTLTAYALCRYRFPGRRLLEAAVDLPLAVPTLCTGVTMLTLLGPRQPVGAWLEAALGVQLLFAPPGLVGALLFVTYPFVVRTVEPALSALERDAEDAAATLGASPLTIFFRVTLPALGPALGAGVLLSFARALGEFGAVVIVAGNIPLKTQTAAVYVLGEIESDNPAGASAMSLILLLAAALLTALVDRLQRSMTRSGR